MVFEDRIIALKNHEERLIFVDVARQKIIAKCEFEKVSTFHKAGDDLIIKAKGNKFHKIAFPFSPKAKQEDF